MKKTLVILITIFIAAIVIVLIFSGKNTSSFEEIKNFEDEISIYKSSSCGCCGVYYNYFRNKGNSNVQTINIEDIEFFKRQKGVPFELESCHTTVMGGYFIEGHVPLEAVEKLLVEKPDIKGIAMPGMPSGSPGMLGAKKGDFIIYAVNHDGTYEEFMRM